VPLGGAERRIHVRSISNASRLGSAAGRWIAVGPGIQAAGRVAQRKMPGKGLTQVNKNAVQPKTHVSAQRLTRRQGP
jgi:hypothetical protein